MAKLMELNAESSLLPDSWKNSMKNGRSWLRINLSRLFLGRKLCLSHIKLCDAHIAGRYAVFREY